MIHQWGPLLLLKSTSASASTIFDLQRRNHRRHLMIATISILVSCSQSEMTNNFPHIIDVTRDWECFIIHSCILLER